MNIASFDFADNGEIPKQFTCQGDNASPSIEINDVPAGAQSLALICDDPDAATDPNGPGHTFDHWVVYNIPPHMTSFGPGAVPTGAQEGLNSSGQYGYTGPCPPTGEHTYIFRAYALDTELQLNDEADKGAVIDAMQGHVIEQAQMTGRYQKQ
jgi:Raf kinase inhibitor-like YbhB/YbcL family protein